MTQTRTNNQLWTYLRTSISPQSSPASLSHKKTKLATSQSKAQAFRHTHLITMKSFVAIITLALATAVAANPAPVDKRQTIPTVCVSPGSTLAKAESFISTFLPIPTPTIITCTAPKTCHASTITILGFTISLPIGVSALWIFDITFRMPILTLFNVHADMPVDGKHDLDGACMPALTGRGTVDSRMETSGYQWIDIIAWSLHIHMFESCMLFDVCAEYYRVCCDLRSGTIVNQDALTKS